MTVTPKMQMLENLKEIAMGKPLETGTELKLECLSDLNSEVLLGSWLV